jgi:hypothetical protein
MSNHFNIIETDANHDPIAFRNCLSVIAPFSKWGPFIYQGRMYETGDIERRQWRSINETHYARFVEEIADVIRRLGYFVECAIPVSVSRGIGSLSAHYWKMITMIKKNDVVIYGDSLEHRIPILENTHPLSGNKRLLIEYELLNHREHDTTPILRGDKLKDPVYYDKILDAIENGSRCFRSPSNLYTYKKYLSAPSTIGNTLPNDIAQALWHYSQIHNLCDREIEFYIPDSMMEEHIDTAVPCSDLCEAHDDHSLHTHSVSAPNNGETNINDNSSSSSSSDEEDDE